MTPLDPAPTPSPAPNGPLAPDTGQCGPNTDDDVRERGRIIRALHVGTRRVTLLRATDALVFYAAQRADGVAPVTAADAAIKHFGAVPF